MTYEATRIPAVHRSSCISLFMTTGPLCSTYFGWFALCNWREVWLQWLSTDSEELLFLMQTFCFRHYYFWLNVCRVSSRFVNWVSSKSWVITVCDSVQGGLCPEGGLSLSRGVSVQRGGLCPGRVSVGGLCPRESLSKGVSVQRGLSAGGLSPEGRSLSGKGLWWGLCPRESLSRGGPLSHRPHVCGTPPTGMHPCYSCDCHITNNYSRWTLKKFN